MSDQNPFDDVAFTQSEKNSEICLGLLGSSAFEFCEGQSQPKIDPVKGLRVSVCAVAFAVFVLMVVLSLFKIEGIDFWAIHLVNSVSERSWFLDGGMHAICLPMFSNVVVMTVVWYVWFETDDLDTRARIVVGVIASYSAGILSRIIQLSFPGHPRPLHEAALHFRLPIGVDPSTLSDWSSFPSDHAAVFFGLATTVFLVNQRLGRLTYFLVSGLIIARIYNGFHYPTDVIGGAALGITFVGLTQHLRRYSPFQQIMRLAASNQPIFYAAAFYVSFGIAQLFNDYREVAAGLVKMLKPHVHG